MKYADCILKVAMTHATLLRLLFRSNIPNPKAGLYRMANDLKIQKFWATEVASDVWKLGTDYLVSKPSSFQFDIQPGSMLR